MDLVVSKCPHLEVLDIRLLHTTLENRRLLLDFVGKVCSFSDSLRTLTLYASFSFSAEGDKLMETLANEESINKLEQVMIAGEDDWF